MKGKFTYEYLTQERKENGGKKDSSDLFCFFYVDADGINMIYIC